MQQQRLESLLERLVMKGPREPLSAECLGIKAIIGLLDRPDEVRTADLQHVTSCAYCQRAIALARRERSILDANPSPGPIILPPWFTAVSAMAAMVVVAVGVRLWLTPDTSPLLGAMNGSFQPVARVRSAEEAKTEYRVEVELIQPAYLIFLYLDRTRKLKLPDDTPVLTERFPVGPQSMDHIDVTKDPPGLQWIAAVASESEFNPFELRDELQEAINAMPDEAPFERLADRLREAMDERPNVSFRTHLFEVPADDP